MWRIGRAGPGEYATDHAGTVLGVALLAASCTSERPLASGPHFSNYGVPARVVGEVEIVWPGGKGREIPPGEEKLAFAEITIFDGTDASPARGEFIYRVLNADGTLHREIVADITQTVVEYDLHKAWALGVVVSDEKLCSGSGGCDGHDGGDSGGCDGHDGGDEGSCSGGGDMGGGGMGGGCTGETDEGGCSGDEGGCSGDEGGCSGDEGGCSGDEGGCSGDGHTGGGGVGGVPGSQPRVGQIVVIKLHDRGTPGFSDDGDDTNDDGITWKWFLAENAPAITDYLSWAHLCKKTIIGGNLTLLPARP